MAYDVEALLHAALNGQPLPRPKGATIRKNFTPPAHFKHQITVKYSVQESWGGPRFVFSHKENSINRNQVKQNAIEKLHKLGYINEIFLDLEST
jgi:hypothetical protein